MYRSTRGELRERFKALEDFNGDAQQTVVELIDAIVFLPGRVASRPVQASLIPGGLMVMGAF